MSTRREHTFVLLSGISCTVREMIGEQQRIITEGRNRKKGGGNAFNKMLASCIVRLGEKTFIDEEDIDKMLAYDRKHALLELRQFTLDYQEAFEFDYEWPADKGKKDKQHYSIEFSPEDFQLRPYWWVRERWEQDQEEAKARMNGSYDPVKVPLPELFSDYREVLKMREYETTLPRAEKKVRMKLLDGTDESKVSIIPEDDTSSHTPLMMRQPRYVDIEQEKERLFSVNLDKLFFKDIQHLRKEYKDKEGYIDTTLVIKNQKQPDKQVRVDLIGLPDFFFPSTGI